MNVTGIQFTRTGLQHAGFQGFHHLYERRQEFFSRVPVGPGVYAILRDSERGPDEVLYIGRGDCLRRRLSSLATKRGGERSGQWTGQQIWQIPDTENLTIAWLPTPSSAEAPGLRTRLLDSFQAQHGRAPFANKRAQAVQ